MKKLLLPIIAFLVMSGVGGGAGVVLMKPAASPADSAHADSTHGDSTKTGDSTSHGTTVAHDAPADSNDAATGAASHAASGSAPASTSAHDTGDPKSVAHEPGKVTVASLVRAQAGATVSLRPDGTVGPEAKPGAVTPDWERMARLLAKMGPREAAKTIEQLPPAQAARALAEMPDKNAAAVLQQLAPEKAAALLQSAITLIPKVAAP